jgi:hypothetical protein
MYDFHCNVFVKGLDGLWNQISFSYDWYEKMKKIVDVGKRKVEEDSWDWSLCNLFLIYCTHPITFLQFIFFIIKHCYCITDLDCIENEMKGRNMNGNTHIEIL